MVKYITISAIVIILLIYIWVFYTMNIKPLLDKRLELKDKEIKNKKYELFINTSPELMIKSIDEYFEKYVTRYITYKFISNKVMYIKQEDVDKMVRDLTKSISIEISELYVFYINTTVNINTDEELIRYIHSKVMNICVEQVMNYNKSMIS